MFRASRFILPALVLLAAVVVSRAEPKEGAAPVAAGESATSSMRVQELAPMTFFHTTVRTSYEKMDMVGPIIEELMKAVSEKDIDTSGTVVFVYQGASPDPTKEFELSIGMPVTAGTKGFDKWEVKDLPLFKCATVMHSGNVRTIGSAYQKLFPELMEKGLQPTGETREHYMYWEGEQSDNNVMLVQVGVK